MTRKKIIIVDSSVIISGFNIGDVDAEIWITESALKEIKSTVPYKVEPYLHNKIKIIDVPPMLLKDAKQIAKQTGDFIKLSDTDLELIALMLYARKEGHNVVIATNDYAIQNIAKHLRIEIVAIGYNKINEVRLWGLFCPICKRTFPSNSEYKICPYCNVKLKRFKIKKTH